MNRRYFFKINALLGVGMSLFPLSTIGDITDKPDVIPLYQQFEWVCWPQFLLFRVEKHNSKSEVISSPFTVKTERLKIRTTPDIDLSTEKIKYHTTDNKEYDVNTNEILLKEVKAMGYTHLYAIVSHDVVDDKLNSLFRCYYVRGVKAPNWTSNKGKLKI